MSLRNLRYAIRSFRQNPVLVTTAVLSLSLGIGANTAIFSLIDQLLLRSLPVKNPQELVQFAARGMHMGSNYGFNAMSYPMYMDFRDKNTVFNGVLCRFGNGFAVGDGRNSNVMQGELVSGNYFDVLGVPAYRGRVITPADDGRDKANPVVVLSADYWKTHFNNDPAVIGRTLYVNNFPLTVIGVAPPRFFGVEIGEAPAVFMPVKLAGQLLPQLTKYYNLKDRRGRWMNAFARLKPGVSREQAEAALQPLYKQIIELEAQEPAFKDVEAYGRKRFLESQIKVFDGANGRSPLRRQFTTPLYVLLSLTGLVLLIACANVANLLIARSTARQKEMAVRLALGATRRQLIAQLLSESTMLAGVSAGLGILVGVWLTKVLLSFSGPDADTLVIRGELDLRVLLFSIGIAFLSSMLFGLAPALQSTKTDVASTLKSQASGVIGGAGASFRKGLVVVQVGLSLLLLISSALFVRSLMNLRTIDPGFAADHLVTYRLNPTASGRTSAQTFTLYRQLEQRLNSLPGVVKAGYAQMAIMSGNEWDSTIKVEGYHSKDGEDMNPLFNAISPDYFETLKVPLLQGRFFSDRDVTAAPKVCIVNETFAKHYFPKGDAVGHHIGLQPTPTSPADVEIVGVTRSMKYQSMREEQIRQVFLPYSQMESAQSATYYVRTAVAPELFASTVRSVVRDLDPKVPVVGLRTFEQQVDLSLVAERMIAGLSAAFGFLATGLAVIGLYGVMSFSVAKRAKEIGIRIALGANRGSVISMVMREAVVLLAVGVVVAIPIYFGLQRFVQSQLYGMEGSGFITVIGAVLLLSAVTLMAGYAPARRASRIDPIRILRYE